MPAVLLDFVIALLTCFVFCFFLQGYATACLALLQLGMYSCTERPDLALAHEQPWVRF